MALITCCRAEETSSLLLEGKGLSNYFAYQATIAEPNFPPNRHYVSGKIDYRN